MLQHSFVLDALETTAADTFLHFEVLIEEHRALEQQQREYMHTPHQHGQAAAAAASGQHHRSTSNVPQQLSRLKQLVPTIGSFHTALPLREAFEIYNEKHRLVRTAVLRAMCNDLLATLSYVCLCCSVSLLLSLAVLPVRRNGSTSNPRSTRLDTF